MNRFKKISVFLVLMFVTMAVFAYQLTPLSVTYDPRGAGSAKVYTITNDSDSPIAIQVKPFKRMVDADGNEFTESANAYFSIQPQKMIIKPQSTQLVRVQYRGPQTVTKEMSFRIQAEQIPYSLGASKEETGQTISFLFVYSTSAYVKPSRVVESVRTTQGTAEEIMKVKESITGAYLSGRIKIPVPEKREKPTGWITVRGASENNLKNIDVAFPLGIMTCVTGVSGSGKSSLVNEILYKTLAGKLNHARVIPGKHKCIEGIEQLDKVINIDQSPIGRTPRSNPATYTGVFDLIRDLFAATSDAKARGYKKGRFSFNVKGGRCEACNGDGIIKIEMHFLPDVYVPCEVCKGKRYNRETLDVKYKGKNIDDVLNMTVEEALHFFENVPSIKRKMETLYDVGLGYIRLGQPSTTLSGGEAQRIKLATELSRRSTGKTVYILDEPTTGLHFADVHKLTDILRRLSADGNTVIVIEHNLDVIKTADYIIDIGPEGGDKGGTVIATGTPEEIAANPVSYTGKYIDMVLKKS